MSSAHPGHERRTVVTTHGRGNYVWVADWVESRIKLGELKPDALAARIELARDFGVAYDTVRRAAVLLRERRLIFTVHGRGTYVA
jgi:DNA-binding GntR family transcriptional regulator